MGMAPVDSEDRWHTFSCEVCGGHLIDEQNECTRCMRAERDKYKLACDRFRSVALSFLIWLDAIMPSGPGGPMPLALANIMRENKIDPDREFAEEMERARKENTVEKWIP